MLRRATMKAFEIIKNVCDNTSSKVKVIDLAVEVYYTLNAEGYNAFVVNEKGVEFDRKTIWFRRDNKNNCWKAFMVVDFKNEYL